MDLVEKCGRLRKMGAVVGAERGRVSGGECLCPRPGVGCWPVTPGWSAFHGPQHRVSPYGGAGKRPVAVGRGDSAEDLGSQAESPAFTSAAISSVWPEETVRGGRIRAVSKSEVHHSYRMGSLSSTPPSGPTLSAWHLVFVLCLLPVTSSVCSNPVCASVYRGLWASVGTSTGRNTL